MGQRCITLEGDDFNPSGLLTGGSRAISRSLLTLLHELAAKEADMKEELRSRLQQAEGTRRLTGRAGSRGSSACAGCSPHPHHPLTRLHRCGRE